MGFLFRSQKLQERRATLTKFGMAQEEKDKWTKVLMIRMMSSEESNPKNEEIISVKPLPWRAEKISTFFHLLDSKVQSLQSVQAK